ncbi:MAG: helix-turn-helix domain-containing protein [Nitrososphaeria archaeon]
MENDEIYKLVGRIVLSDNPGTLLRTLRNNLNLKQKELAELMGVSPPVISDYEKGRRRKAGVRFIKKYLDALIKLKGVDAVVLSFYQGDNNTEGSGILEIKDYRKPLKVGEFVEGIGARVLSGENMLEHHLFGHTILDSIKAIITLKGEQFYRIFGKSSERALIFTKVGIGRSPMVAVRISPLKPRLVVVHGTSSVEPLAVEMARVENVMLAIAPQIDIQDLISRIREVTRDV